MFLGHYDGKMCLTRSAIRTAIRVATVLLACQLIHSARAVIRDGGIDPSNLGKGDWIYILPNAVNHMGGNVPSVTDLKSMMIFLKNQGLRYIIIKAASGPTLYPSDANPQFTAEVVNAGHAAGLWVFGYNRSDGIDIPGEIAVADYVFNVGADGFVFDAEIEWESHYLPNNAVKAEQLCSAVRSNWPTKFLAHAPFPIISYHSTFPFKEFGYYCDAVMPQDYWIEIGVSPTYMVSWMTTQWKNWQNGLSGKWVNSIKPIVGLGQGWHGSGTVDAEQVTEFFTALKNQVNPATTGGYKGANFWRAELHPMEVWDAIRTNSIGNPPIGAPVIGNVSDSNVTTNSATITWTTDQSSDSVVEYGPDTGYGTSVTNSTPIYYHTVVLNGLSPSTLYHYRVRSKNSSGNTSVSADYVLTTVDIAVNDVIVESYLPGGGLNSNPPYTDAGFVAYSSCKSSASGLIGAAKVQYATGGGGTPSVTLRPTLPVAGGSYDVYVTHCGASVSPDIVAAVGQSGCSGLPATTTVFQSGGANTWELVGRMTLNPGVTVPTITFTRSSGTLSGSSRMYSDGYKFEYVLAPPSIATQPQSQTNNQGNAATFSVVASGARPLIYQWRFNGANIAGATWSSYTRNNIQPADAGSYSVFITNRVGSVTSSNAVLTVIVPPTIVVQPADIGVGAGMNATFNVTAVGTGTLQYQWRFNGTNLAGATTTSYTVNNVQPANAGPYEVIVSSPYGTNTSYSAFLNLLDPCISTQPANKGVPAGGTAVFTASAIGTLPMTWRWRKNGVDLADGDNISGAGTSSLTVANVQWSDMAYYSVMVSNVNGTAVSSNATLVGPFPPSVVVQPADQTANAGSTATFTVGAFGAGTLAFQWKRDGTNLANGTKFSGADTAALAVTKLQAWDMQSYSVVVTNNYGSTTSSNALLSLWPLAGWGQNTYTQADIPAGLTSVSDLAAGLQHSLVLKADGTVVAWGAGQTSTGLNPNYGQAIVPGSLTEAVSLAAGFYHSLALKSDGTLAAWGAGTTYTGADPHYGQAIVPPAAAGVMAIAAGAYHSLALKSNGTVVAWGAGTNKTGMNRHYGQSAVPAGLSNVVAIAAGAYHSLALKSDGTVVAWGAGTTWTGGTPDFGQSEVPIGLSNVTAIAGGGYHSLALKADGMVVGWGAGTNDTGGSPDFGQAQLPGGITDVAAIAAGLYHSLVVKADGKVVAWGLNNNGQANAPGLMANVVAVAGGGYHSLAMAGEGVAPAITAQPQNQNVNQGSNATFSVVATGTPAPGYQWRKDGAPIGGATGSSYTVANAQPADAGSYSVLVSNSAGEVTSADAVLTVNVAPTITTQPQNQNVNQSGDAFFSVVATGTPAPSYQWRKDGAAIGGATGSSYTVANAQPADAGSYSVLVSNSAGEVTSADAVLTVNVAPTITTQPQNQNVNQSGDAFFSVVATGTPAPSYQWRKDGAAIGGATGSSYTVANAQPADEGSYSVVVSNIAGTLPSADAVLTVNVAPTITAHPQDLSVTAGSNATFTVTATGAAPLGYQWRFGAEIIAGATGSAYTLNNAQDTNAGSYSVVVSNVAGTVASSNAVLTVTQLSNQPHIDSITRLPDGTFQLQISGGPGNFAIECSPLPSGLTQFSSLTATGAVFQYIDPETTHTSRFYRVKLLP